MRRCTPDLILRLKRLAHYKARAKKKHKGKRKAKQWEFVRPGEYILAPEIVDLSPPNGVRLIKFLRAVSNTVLELKKQTRLDFRKTESLHVSGAILLFAELDRIIKLAATTKPITIIEPRRRRAREVLKQIGIFQLTEDKSDVVPTRDDVVFWKTTQGSDQTGDKLGSILECVAEKANQEHIKQVEINGIWRGVSEAVANTVDHAYEKPRSDGFSGLPDTKWWMFTQVRNQHFTAAVCDLGCGYRSTVNLTIPESFIAKYKQIFTGKNPDSVAVLTAMEYGKSGTHESHRGRGSRDALSVLERHGTGELYILSNTGWVGYDYKDGHKVETHSGSIGIDIRGTIIWWRLPLKDN